MDNKISFNIDDNILNIFTSKDLDELIKEYNIDKYICLLQIHSTTTHIVDENSLSNQEGDALITNKKNIALTIRTADCIPIVLYDKKNKVIAAIHSGWVGTLNNITKEVVEIMINNYNSQPENIYAYIYPSIKKCHFEVEEDVYTKFKNKINNINKYVNKSGIKYYIDLQEIVKDNLKELGINNISDSFICTYCNHDVYYSYRYNHTDKRNNLLVMIKE